MNKTIIDFLNEAVENFGDRPFLYEARNDAEYTSMTYKEVQEKARQFAAGLIDLGIEAGDRVALISEGKNNWIVGELGVLHIGAVCVPLSVKLDTEQDIAFRVNHSECRAIMASDQQITKLRPMKKAFTNMEHYILLDPEENLQEQEVLFENIVEKGKKLLAKNPAALDKRIKKVTADSLANISYTSGTTANPKGIMLSHGNYVCNSEQAVELLNGIPSYFRQLLILPWDHSFGHTAGIYSFMKCGASLASVAMGKTPIEVLRNVPKSIKAINPHLMMSVPALASSFRKNIEAGIEQKGKFTSRLFRRALKTAYAYNKEGYNKGTGGTAWMKPLLAFYDKLIFSKVRQSFASNMQFFIGGGALLDIELQRFFYAIGIPMYQGYGLSEATPIISANSTHAHKLGSSGKPVPHMDIKIVDDNLEEVPTGEKGEIIIRGGNVMKGYWKNPEATAETIVDGWLRTGDMGYLDSDGYLYVLGRTKSLLISDDGEKFSPEGIEESMTAKSRYIDQIVLYNNQRPYTTALIVVNPTELKKRTTDPTEAALLIEKQIAKYLKGGKYEDLFPTRWIPSGFAILEEPFSDKNGMVNSTMKIVKHKVYEAYASRIDELYTTEGKKATSPSNIKALENVLK
ncbi:MAG TPA: AMP-binding protein [Bacteroidales bacterium]|nr:AMP-binding protein [Bacteroidales bacterium]